jgi:hypothetical protein
LDVGRYPDDIATIAFLCTGGADFSIGQATY